MHIRQVIINLGSAMLLTACASFNAAPTPTLIPTLTPSIPPSPVIAPITPPPFTPIPTLIARTQTPAVSLSVPPATFYPEDQVISIGESWEGRELKMWQFGSGQHVIVLIGGIHAGFEANTVRLGELLVEHFKHNPADVLPDVHLYIMPLANPDGLRYGDTLKGRLNSRGVDLNRNWGCEWSDEANVHNTPVSPGTRPFSEIETFTLRAFLAAVEPEAVVFYHSAVGGIFMGECQGVQPGSDWMPIVLERATGYPHRRFTYYDVTGDATNWLAERGIPSAVIELATANQPEFEQNLAGVIALQCYLVITNNTELLNQPDVQRLCKK
jgi:hypothetical protein